MREFLNHRLCSAGRRQSLSNLVTSSKSRWKCNILNTLFLPLVISGCVLKLYKDMLFLTVCVCVCSEPVMIHTDVEKKTLCKSHVG